MKHTPGPWKIWELQDRDYSVEIASVEAGCTVGAAYHINDDPVTPCDETMANARLIAAAPELLEACKKVLEHIKIIDKNRDFFNFDNDSGPILCRDKIEAAIAKAEGVTE